MKSARIVKPMRYRLTGGIALLLLSSVALAGPYKCVSDSGANLSMKSPPARSTRAAPP